MNAPTSILKKDKVEFNLSDFIDKENIQFTGGNVTWKEALRISMEPLVRDQIVSPEYVDALIAQSSEPTSYSYLRGRIAIPHAIPKMGVKKDGFGFLISKEPINFPGHSNVSVVAPLAITGEKNYMNAINQLVKLSKNDTALKRLCHTCSADMALRILNSLHK